MDYDHIKNYLDKFRNIIFSKEENYKIIIDIIKKNTSIEVETKSIQIRNHTIYIKASPLVHSEILMHKEKILKDLISISQLYNYKDIK